jgi:hypothetical protein
MELPHPTQHWRHTLSAALAALIALGAIASLQIPSLRRLQGERTLTDAELERQLLLEANRLAIMQRSPAFGFDNLMANWAFLGFVQYFGDTEARRRTDYSLSPEYFEIILRRDPGFVLAYVFLSTSVSQYAGQPERAVEIMDRNITRIHPNAPPNSFFVWRQKAIDELLFLGDGETARRSFETAADWAEQSTWPGSANSAAISRQTAQFLAENPDSTAAQIGAWTLVLQNAVDEQTLQNARDRIESLGGQFIENPDGGFTIRIP